MNDSRRNGDLTQSELDAAEWRDLHNLRSVRDDPALPGHIREAIERRIAELEYRQNQRYLKRLQGVYDNER